MKRSTKMLGSSTGLIALAAFSGILAGSPSHAKAAAAGISPAAVQASVVGAAGVHAARGLDDAAKHDCKGKNACKGQGGCASSDNGCKGKNSCKGNGGCKTNSL